MLQMTLNMKSYSREKKMNGDYSVSSINSKFVDDFSINHEFPLSDWLL